MGTAAAATTTITTVGAGILIRCSAHVARCAWWHDPPMDEVVGTPEPGTVASYLRTFGTGADRRLPPGIKGRIVSVLVPPGGGLRLRLGLTAALRPWSCRVARRIVASGRPLRLHLGSGRHHLEGWVDVDAYGSRPDLVVDLEHPLPFPDRSAEAIFAEHVLEHFAAPVALALVEECHRVLAPGGVLRIVVPDFAPVAATYLQDGNATVSGHVAPSPLLTLARTVYGHGHRTVWDATTLTAVLSDVGFATVEVSEYGAGRLRPSPDSATRAPGSLYVEALR